MQRLIVLAGLRSLRIASNDGAPANEYRIQQDAVEFRAVNADWSTTLRNRGNRGVDEVAPTFANLNSTVRVVEKLELH